MGRRKKKKRKLRAASEKATAKARAKVAAITESKAPPPHGSSPRGLEHEAAARGSRAKKVSFDNPLDRHFFAPIAPVRPYMLLRLALLLLAFDCWVDLIPHAGRYGVGGFNVAHFSILELLPTPTPGVYIGTMLLTGWLALLMAIRPARSGMALLCAAYTYGWSMSMLDSYQHHYLLSLVLFSFIFFPFPAALDLFGPTGEGHERDLGRWRIVGGLLLLLFIADATLAACGLWGPLERVFGDSSLLNGARAGGILLGLLLILLVGEGPKSTGKRTSAWGYVFFCVTCGIVYFYTAITKLAKDWREGHALRRLGNSDSFQELQAQAIGDQGLPLIGTMAVDDFWKLMATGAIAVQLVSAAGYVLAAGQDRFSGWKRFLIAASGFAPLSFHIGTERMELEIGWVSYYMLLVIFVVFLPVEVLRPIGAAFTWPMRFLAERFGAASAEAQGEDEDSDEDDGAEDDAKERPSAGLSVWALLAVGAVSSVGAAMALDLPGATGTGVLIGVVLIAGGGLAVRQGRMREARSWGIGAILAGLGMWIAITQLNDVRYDYYRFVGGDHRRRGELEEALVAYEKANAYQLFPWCVFEGREKGDCFRSEEEAEARAVELGSDWRVRRSDRQAKEEEVRARVEAMRAAGDE